MTISGGEGNDSIAIQLDGFALERNSLSGGAGDDTIKIEGNSTKNPNNITIIGGKGNDYIDLATGRESSLYLRKGGTYHLQYAKGDGDDTVSNRYKNDVLYIEGNDYSTQKSGNGSDVIVYVGNGSILLKEPQFYYTGLEIHAVPVGTFAPTTSGGGNDTTSGGGGTSTQSGGKNLNNNISGKTLTGTSYADSIYNDSSGSKVTISAGDDKDTIFNSGLSATIDGGKGNDKIFDATSFGEESTLSGGKGNDSLWGGSGDNTFVYANGDGKDIIWGFGNNDILQITGAFSTFYSKSKDEIYFKVGSTASAITLKDFDATSFNVNGTNYKISGSKLVRQSSKFSGIS